MELKISVSDLLLLATGINLKNGDELETYKKKSNANP